MDLYKNYLLDAANAGVCRQREDGSLPPGRNNLWNDKDTPVRCTSHFTILFLFAYRWTGENKFLESAQKGLSYLTSKNARPNGFAFYCRESEKKNKCNGLIGQAWAIEALIHGHDVLHDDSLLDLAYNVFVMHDFNHEFGLYYVREIDGTRIRLDLTLNHQLIFAAMGMRLLAKGRDDLREQLERFYSLLPVNILLGRKGVIHHHVRYGRNRLERRLFDIGMIPYRRKIAARSMGFHSFNLFSLALARRNHPGASFWSAESLENMFIKILGYALDPSYLESIKENRFALSARLTGAEIIFFKRMFLMPGEESGVKKLIDIQFQRHWDPNEKCLCKNTADPRTLSSRIYEMCYLFDDVV